MSGANSPEVRNGRPPGARWPRLLGTALLVSLLFGACAVVAVTAKEVEIDTAVRAWVTTRLSPKLVPACGPVTALGSDLQMVRFGVLAALLLLLARRMRASATVLLASAAAFVTYTTLKPLFRRARPAGFPWWSHDRTFAFPSGHATASAAVIGILLYVLYREGKLARTPAVVLGVLVPSAIGFSRVCLDAHWATDVLGGWALGTVIAALCAGLYEWLHTTSPGSMALDGSERSA